MNSKELDMRHEGTVIPLASALDRRTALLAPGLPVLLLRVRDRAAVHLSKDVQTLFDAAEEVLLEQVDRTRDTSEQRRSQQAVRNVRLKRKHVEFELLDAFHQAFAGLAQSTGKALFDSDLVRAPQPRLTRTDNAQTLAMIARAHTREGAVLEQLNARFEALLETPLRSTRGNPLSPACLCRYFAQACGELRADEATTAVLFDLFDQHVLGRLGALYSEANQLLASAGVLPMLTPMAAAFGVRRPSRAGAPMLAAGQGQAIALQAAGQAFFASMQSSLAPLRGQLTPRLRATGAIAVTAQDLARMLSHLQRHTGVAAGAGAFDLGEELQHLLLKISARSGTRRCLGQAEEDTINLLGRVFAAFEQESSLHPRMRALLARMHLPLLKVAVLDKSLLTRASHPARRLFNELASTAIGCQGEADSLYLRLENVVQRVLDDVVEDSSAFKSQLDTLLTASLEERRRNDLLEQRARDAEEGHLRMQRARHDVEAALDRRLRGKCLPLSVLRLVQDAWSQVLLMAWLKHGIQSAAWKGALLTVEQLLASIAPHTRAEARVRLLAGLPALLKALREGLGSIALDSSTSRDFFCELQRLHVQACTQAGDKASAPDPSWIKVTEPIRLPGAEPLPALNEADDVPPCAFKMLERLRIGTWVEVREADSVLRCRLLARVEGSDRYVFANHEGVKLREWHRVALARAVHHGEVRLLNGGRAFDRALRKALDQLGSGQVR
nr:DUF1631 family protein [uncultured Pseudomonas sp.]